MAVTNRTSKGKEVKTFTHERLQYCNTDFCTIKCLSHVAGVVRDNERNLVGYFKLYTDLFEFGPAILN